MMLFNILGMCWKDICETKILGIRWPRKRSFNDMSNNLRAVFLGFISTASGLEAGFLEFFRALFSTASGLVAGFLELFRAALGCYFRFPFRLIWPPQRNDFPRITGIPRIAGFSDRKVPLFGHILNRNPK